jgi:hypothetical protein
VNSPFKRLGGHGRTELREAKITGRLAPVRDDQAGKLNFNPSPTGQDSMFDLWRDRIGSD